MKSADSSKLFWIVLVLFFVAATFTIASAQTYTQLYSFSGTDGATPGTPLTLGTDGNFYGTTAYGGTGTGANCSGAGCGTIFQLTPGGTLNVLQSFDGTNGESASGLIQATDGKFYGTATNTVFSLVPGGTLTNLASIAHTTAPLIQGTDGNFYGTTDNNAQPNVCSGNCGTIFQMTPAGVVTTLYTFEGSGISGGTTPYGPGSGVIQGTDGNFYGTTLYGGNDQCGSDTALYCGTVFKLTPEGVLTTLYTFCSLANCADGGSPGALIQGSDGNFYGVTSEGGAPGACLLSPPDAYCGTIFKITPSGTLTTLHSFTSIDGAEPNTLIQGSDGNFYGTTWSGGGTIFQMTPSGSLITLYHFAKASGDIPLAALLQVNGAFYGTFSYGGANNDGGIFSFAIGIGGTSPSTTSLELSPTTVSVGSTTPVVMTATAAPASGSGTPTGVVAFYVGGNEIGSSDLSSGVSTFNYNASVLALGSYQFTAIYSGDGTFATSTSSPQTLTVNSLPAAATPTFSPAAGSYNSSQSVTITDSTPNTTIYYTNDGTTPSTTSAIYNGPITVDSTQTLQAIAAAASGYNNSAVASATYTITLSPDYQLSVAPSSLTIAAGQSGKATFTVTPMNGFDSPVTFACSGLPAEATCTFSSASVTPSGSPATSTLTITTTAASASLNMPKPFSWRPIYAFLLPFLGMVVGIVVRGKDVRSRVRVLATFALLSVAAGVTSCGGSKSTPATNTGTPPGTATVSVSAATSGSGAITHSAALTITITQ